MNSIERIVCTLEHRIPDRIPVDFWASSGCKEKIKSELHMPYDEFLDAYEVDFRYIEGPVYQGPSLETGDGQQTDIWGVSRKTVELSLGNSKEYYKEVISSPLKEAETPEDIEQYPHWPSPDWFDYSVIAHQCDDVHRKGKAALFMGDRLNRIAQLKPAMYLCGVDKIMMDMAVNPDTARAVFRKISEFYLEYTRRILEQADGRIDIVVTGDDFGSQTGLLVSPDMWRTFIQKGFTAFVDLIHKYRSKVMHHTCGAVASLVTDMIECGLDILQSLQPEAEGMDPVQLKKQYGDKICFQGGVSIQKTMPYGTPEDISSEVRNLAKTLGAGGGYIFCTAHNIQADTSIDNLLALMQAYKEFGKY